MPNNSFPKIIPFRAVYSDRAALLMANFSKLAYEQAYVVQKTVEKQKYEYVRFIPRQGTECFFAQNEELAVLSFRGTEPTRLTDIVTDLNCDLYKDAKGIRIHDGFYKAFMLVKDEVFNTIEKRIKKPLYITGHSLGGALASVAAYFLESEEYPIAACYTYGSPRTGEDNFEDTLEKTPIYRMVNLTDVVPRVPLKVQSYVHVGKLYYLDGAGNLISPENGSEEKSEKDFSKTLLAGMIKRLSGNQAALIAAAIPLIKNHNIDNYIAKLEKIALERN